MAFVWGPVFSGDTEFVQIRVMILWLLVRMKVPMAHDSRVMSDAVWKHERAIAFFRDVFFAKQPIRVVLNVVVTLQEYV